MLTFKIENLVAKNYDLFFNRYTTVSLERYQFSIKKGSYKLQFHKHNDTYAI